MWPPPSGVEGLGLSGTREDSSSRLEREGLSRVGMRHGVLLVLITADTRRGTETAKGSEMFSAFLWCRGEASKGKRLLGKPDLAAVSEV